MEINKETEITEPFPHAVAALEGKIKSLQQLKKRIESLKKAQKNGHSLNFEQLSLVARLEDVQGSLKNLLHVQRQFACIARDTASERRQRALRTELERTRQDITRIKEILLVQDVLENMRKEEVRKDFLCGQNGAVRLSEEALDNLDDFYVEISLVRGTADEFPAFQDQLQQSAEHLLALVDGREAEIIGTTYAKLKGVITAICMCGYFDYLAKEASSYSDAAQNREAEEKGTDEDDAEMEDRYNASSQAVVQENVKACNGFKRSQEVVSSSTEEEIAKELPSSVPERQNGARSPQVRKSTRVKVASRRLSGFFLESWVPVTDKGTEPEERPLCCSVCKAVFPSQCSLQSHMHTHTTKRFFSCEICHERFSLIAGLEDHMQTHATKKQHRCKLCEATFSFCGDLKKHMRWHTSKNQFDCSSCKASFSRKSVLQKHITAKHSCERPNVCDLCNAKFPRKVSLKIHLRIAHAIGAPFHCNVCKAQFFKRVDLWAHSTSHPDEKPVLCTVCKARFATENHLKSHMRFHSARNKQYECSDCGAVFSSRDTIIVHMRIHSGEKPFSCDVCGMSFARKEIFKKHFLIHCDDKDFSLPNGKMKWKYTKSVIKTWNCRYCKATFNHKNEFKVHTLVHNDKKPFSCSVCGAKFIGINYLDSHMRSHSNEKPYRCKICKARFGYTSSLKQHMLIHLGIKPYKCTICGSSFSRKGTLYSHMYIHVAKKSENNFAEK